MIATSVMSLATGGVDGYRCALLQASPLSGLQERIDLGRMAQMRGDDDGALLLLAGVGLELGFGRGALAWWRDMGAATGLWSVSWDLAQDGPDLFCVDRAMQEMRAVATTVAASLENGLAAPVAAPIPSRQDQVAHDVATVAARVREALAAFLSQPELRVGPLFQLLARELVDQAPTDVRQWASAPEAVLARLVAILHLRQRVLTGFVFLQPPLGSPALLEHVARLSDDGIGPWFGALSRLTRDGEDLLAWSYAAGEGLLPETLLPSWTVLLAATASRPRWRELGREFGRFGIKAGLEAALGRLTYLPLTGSDGYEINDLRDICLDRRIPDLAIRVQRQVVIAHPLDNNERVTLGDMLALTGREEEGLSIFSALLAANPEDDDLRQRVTAARGGGLAAYSATHGFFGDAEQGSARRRAMVIAATNDPALVIDRRSSPDSQ